MADKEKRSLTYSISSPENFYHIFNRGNDGINIFCNQENYYYFLKKSDKPSKLVKKDVVD